MERKNKFGTAEIITQKEFEKLEGRFYVRCVACMSIFSDFASYIQGEKTMSSKQFFVSTPEDADYIIVLGCQVTDLAVLNDLNHIKELQQYNKPIYLGGCVAQRFDITLENTKRLDVIRNENHFINKISETPEIDYAKPFWVKNFKSSDDDFAQGNLFRNMTPIQIGAGCHGKCEYYTIKDTRGKYFESSIKEDDFIYSTENNIVLIADSPSINQIQNWCKLVLKKNKPISIRNVEPHVVVKCKNELLELSQNGLLYILHSPIQHLNQEALKDMKRNVETTMNFINLLPEFRKNKTKLATNIIIDYKNYDNPCFEKMKLLFDYVSWNPYWDGKWDLKKAQERWDKYFSDK